MTVNRHTTTESDEDEGAPVAAPTHAERCRTLVTRARSAVLCTVAREPSGYPYGSLVTIAFDERGQPLLLISRLAEHTQNLRVQPQASVLVTEPHESAPEPLAVGRLSLLGLCRETPPADLEPVRQRFLEAQPGASYYVGFGDFAFYKLEVEAIRYIGGFGRMSWVDPPEYARAEADPLRDAAPEILAHMNGDHADALLAYARGLCGIADATVSTMTAVDRYGFEMAVTTPERKRARRLAFAMPVATTDEVRRAMVALVKEARARLGSTQT
jgi:putative heme iron utilization protein